VRTHNLKQKILEQRTNCNKATKLNKQSPLYIIIYTNGKNLHLYRTHNQCGDTIEKSQALDDGCIDVRNMLSIEEVK